MKSNYKYLVIIFSVFLAACASNPYGKKVKDPFSGSKYESNARFFRASGKGQSSKENIAKSKANLEAKGQIASQVNTTIKTVSDQYLAQTENENAAEVADKFQSLVREVMNTDLADLRKVGEEKYFNESKYTVFVAYEIKKNAMFKFLKKQAKTNKKVDQKTRAVIEDIIDEELKKLEESGN